MLSKQKVFIGWLLVAAVAAIALGQVLAHLLLGARQTSARAPMASVGEMPDNFSPFDVPDEAVFAVPPKGLPPVIVPRRCRSGCTPGTPLVTDENGPLLMPPTFNLPDAVITASADDSLVPQPTGDAQPVPAAKPQQGAPHKSASEPDTLSAPADASPIQESQEVRDELTRAIIRQELPNATEEERTIWFEELREFPPRMTADLLRLRKMFSGHSGLKPSEISSGASPGAEAKPAKEPANSATTPAPTLTPHSQTTPDAQATLQPAKPAVPNMRARALTGADSGLPNLELSVSALETARDVIVNNIANANTVGFKRFEVHLSDAPYRTLRLPGSMDAVGKLAPTGLHVGMGTQVAATSLDVSQGALKPTKNSLDLAIVGEGFFMIQNGSETVYARAGTFTRNSDGDVVLADAHDGRLIDPNISIRADAGEIVISPDGNVSVRQAGSSNLSQIGQIQIARFVNPGGLVPRGDNLFGQSDASGNAIIGPPGINGLGTLKQHALEMSNVNLREELQELERLQNQLRALEQARAITGSDWSNGRNSVPESTDEIRPIVPAPATAAGHQAEQGPPR